jgi:hypothetical protein
MAFEVDADYVKARILPTLIGVGARYANVISPDEITLRVQEERHLAEQRLSTRFELTEFRGWMGPGARPEDVPPVPATNTTPAVEGIEYEGPYQWPSLAPGAGYLEWRLNYRPVIEIIKGTLVLPGTTQPGIDILSEWLRTDSGPGEGTLMPRYGMAALVLPNLPFGLFQFMKTRIPKSMLWNYRAGMGAKEWRLYPQINRLVALKVAIGLLPTLSLRINPSGALSTSADGLSVSRKSGYAFSDIEERLKKEAEMIEQQTLDAWDGNSTLVVL